jgi:hypothetical protein
MIFQELTEGVLRQSLTSMVMVVISLIIGITILLRYFEYKEKTLLTVGLTWIFLTTPWWGEVFSLISFFIVGAPLEPFTFLFIVNFFIPLALLCWIYSYCELLQVKRKNVIVIIFVVIAIVYNGIIIALLLTDTKLVGTISERFTARQTDFVVFFQIFAILTLVITGIRFSISSLKSERADIKLKGKFLLAAFILFLIGASMDAAIAPMDFITLIITRIILISACFCYYIGFLLPERVAKMFLKENID